jgi:hypothetical protein
MLPLLNRGRVELLDHARCIAQICCLERQVSRGGRDNINHPPGTHDDVANAVAGAIVTALQAALQNVPLVMPVFISKSGEVTPALASSSTNGIPPHYLKQNQGAEPWRGFHQRRWVDHCTACARFFVGPAPKLVGRC